MCTIFMSYFVKNTTNSSKSTAKKLYPATEALLKKSP